VKIRFANQSDIPAFVDAGRQVHASTRFGNLPYDVERVSKTLKGIVERPNGSHCFIVAVDDKDAPVGWVIGCIEQHFFCELPIASIINFGVLPERRMSGAGLRLLTAFRKWAENRNAVELSAGVNSGTELDRMDSFLRKLGFVLTGGNYSLSLNIIDDIEKESI
jgi:hypothetical protein